MPFTELVFPPLKTDKATIEEVNRDWPIAARLLTVPNPGMLSVFRGWIRTENDQDMRDAFREIVVLGKLFNQ